MINCCLFQRPTARELLKNRFLRQARKTSYLVELIERLRRWRAEEGDTDSLADEMSRGR